MALAQVGAPPVMRRDAWHGIATQVTRKTVLLVKWRHAQVELRQRQAVAAMVNMPPVGS